ncbi:YceI family protein [Pseudochryseolinea flava]|uniref:YceI family protein n=1 Tax=Pseudochryseolinea flava TaxID=2059302 RepID=A0A364Y5S1_9BACT|nr:YceI family protein [Pseudochryseolinea flava]RAW02182.1 YceI family protein [Pseudochryseolinea flava]
MIASISFSFYCALCLLSATIKTPTKETRVQFSINNAGLTVTGSIDSVIVNIAFDPEHLSNATIEGIAFASSINTGIDIRDRHLQRDDYLHTALYPEIRLVSKTLKRVSKHRFTGTFDLTIKNTTKPITIPFSVSYLNGRQRFNANFKINRLDYLLGDPSPILGNIVTISITSIAE